MPRRGENIYKRKDGRWEGRYIRRYAVDGKAKYGSVYGKTYAETKEKLAVHRVKNQKAKRSNCNLTVSELMALWLQERVCRVKQSSYVCYSMLVERHISPDLGSLYVRELNAEKLETYPVPDASWTGIMDRISVQEGEKKHMNKDKIYLSTIAPDTVAVAREYGFGLEIAEYCTAWNMDEKFAGVDGVVKKKLEGISRSTLHAPYNELFPCAIDKKARSLAADRYRQAIALAKRYGSSKVIIHGGYNPWIYYPIWYVEQSIVFWKEFLREDPGVKICLENVLETEPQWLLDIVRGVDDPRLRMCLDVGHANAYSKVPLMTWLESWAPYISHFHIHNNDGFGTNGTADQHRPLNEGSIPMKQLLQRIDELCPDATIALELMKTRSSAQWLLEEGII